MSWRRTKTIAHDREAARFINNGDHARWHDEALWFVRTKRDRAAALVPEWEALRSAAAQIKDHTLANLDRYLDQFQAQAEALGAHVHWARDASEHNRIAQRILQDQGVRRVVKSKSMLTEECQLNPFLEQHGFQIVDTDLGEHIVQLRQEPPSHIVLPAIHIKKEEVGTLFHKHLGTPAGACDPVTLAEAARQHLRQVFLDAEAGITGVNFAIAETGGLVVCTNEGNVDLGASLPKLHIACMGIEKVIPRLADLGVFLRLLARSATGQPITTYTSHFHGPAAGGELHIILVDNGRTEILGNGDFRSSLRCIRCGACMNTCPVYRRSGGHSYAATVPGPIGSILGPLQDAVRHQSLPTACSLCGSCTDVCPVKIDLHHQLWLWRRELRERGIMGWRKRLTMWAAGQVLRRPWLYEWTGYLARVALRNMPRWLLYQRCNTWGQQRELPPAPPQSFRDWIRARKAAYGNGREPDE